VIYFILDRFNQAIKIGQTSKPFLTLSATQVGNCQELELLAVLNHRPTRSDDPSIPPITVEWLKAKFRKSKIRGTWFQEGPVRKWLHTGCVDHFIIADYDFRHLP